MELTLKVLDFVSLVSSIACEKWRLDTLLFKRTNIRRFKRHNLVIVFWL